MALAIDTKDLPDRVKHDEESIINGAFGSGGRFQLQRACSYAIVAK
jgi:hypothetical protein